MKISIEFFFLTAVISCQQLLKDDENKNQPRELKFGKDITNPVYTKILVNFFFHISCYQLSLDVNS